MQQPKPADKPKPTVVNAGDLPEGITIEDVKDPDRIENMVSMTYIDKSFTQIRAKVQSFVDNAQRIPPEVREKMNAISRKKGVKFFFHNLLIVNHQPVHDWRNHRGTVCADA